MKKLLILTITIIAMSAQVYCADRPKSPTSPKSPKSPKIDPEEVLRNKIRDAEFFLKNEVDRIGRERVKNEIQNNLDGLLDFFARNGTTNILIRDIKKIDEIGRVYRKVIAELIREIEREEFTRKILKIEEILTKIDQQRLKNFFLSGRFKSKEDIYNFLNFSAVLQQDIKNNHEIYIMIDNFLKEIFRTLPKDKQNQAEKNQEEFEQQEAKRSLQRIIEVTRSLRQPVS